MVTSHRSGIPASELHGTSMTSCRRFGGMIFLVFVCRTILTLSPVPITVLRSKWSYILSWKSSYGVFFFSGISSSLDLVHTVGRSEFTIPCTQRCCDYLTSNQYSGRSTSPGKYLFSAAGRSMRCRTYGPRPSLLRLPGGSSTVFTRHLAHYTAVLSCGRSEYWYAWLVPMHSKPTP